MNVMPNPPPIFDTKLAGVDYKIRPAAYAIILSGDGKLAASQARRGYFLPGGGADAGELPEETVKREIFEETARDAAILQKLGEAIEYFTVDNRYYQLQAVFYLAEFTSEPQGDGEHPLVWLALPDSQSFFYQCHNWIVRQV